MSRCAELFIKFKKEGNFCGLSKQQARHIERFIPFAEFLSKESGIEERILYNNVSVTSVLPVLHLKKDNPLRIKAEEHIITTLKRGMSPTAKFIEDALGIEHPSKKLVDNTNAIKKEITQRTILVPKHGSQLSELNRAFLSLLSPGQAQQWREFAARKDLDTEYGALCYLTAHLDNL